MLKKTTQTHKEMITRLLIILILFSSCQVRKMSMAQNHIYKSGKLVPVGKPYKFKPVEGDTIKIIKR